MLKRGNVNQREQLFTIQQISLKLDIPKSTLRFWEKDLNRIIVPHRTRGGQRRYTVGHLSILKEIKHLRGSGMGLAEIKRKLGNSNSMRNHNLDSNKMDLLAMRVAEVVRAEISSFFQRENLKSKFYEADE